MKYLIPAYAIGGAYRIPKAGTLPERITAALIMGGGELTASQLARLFRKTTPSERETALMELYDSGVITYATHRPSGRGSRKTTFKLVRRLKG